MWYRAQVILRSTYVQETGSQTDLPVGMKVDDMGDKVHRM